MHQAVTGVKLTGLIPNQLYRLTQRRHRVQTVDNAEVVKLGTVVDDSVAERLEILMVQDLTTFHAVVVASSGRLRLAVLPWGSCWWGRGLEQLSDLLQRHGVVVVGDLGRVLGDPAQNFVGTPRSFDQPLHCEECVVAHLLVDEVPRLLLAARSGCCCYRCPPAVGVELGMVLIMGMQGRWSQVRRLRVRVVVVVLVVEVGPSVAVGSALVQRVGRGRLGWVAMVRNSMG